MFTSPTLQYTACIPFMNVSTRVSYSRRYPAAFFVRSVILRRFDVRMPAPAPALDRLRLRDCRIPAMSARLMRACFTESMMKEREYSPHKAVQTVRRLFVCCACKSPHLALQLIEMVILDVITVVIT